MKLRTITTIELSNACTLKCLYCVNRLMPGHGREYGIMNKETFERSLFWLKTLCDQGTQQEVNLNGNGESLMDPDLVDRIRRVKDIMGGRQVSMSTNGTLMTYELACKIKDAGIERCDLSPHSVFHARRAAIAMGKAGLSGIVNMGSILTSHNWAGQLEECNQIEMFYSIKCDPLIEGRGYIQREGGVSPCCYDFRGLGQFGTVFDDDLLDRPIKAYALCKTCHQIIPEELKEEVRA
jgi:hypothetical protein